MILSVVFYMLLLLFGLFVLILLLAFLFNLIITPLWLRMPSPEGKMIPSPDKKLFARIKGEGNPVVIIETWNGGPSFEWWPIQDELAKHCRVVTYDRAGYGWSEPGTFPRTSSQIVSELKAILENANVTGPYILVGHSMGALYINHFARIYPEYTAAVVMIDPFSIENQRWYDEFPDHSNYYDKTRAIAAARKYALSGLMRLFRFTPYQNIPKKIKRLVINHYSSQRAYKAMLSELENWKSNVEQIGKMSSFPDVPLKILFPSSDATIKNWMSYKMPEKLARDMEKLHLTLAENMLGYSSKSEMIRVPDTTHALHLDQPELVAEKLIQLIYELR